MIVPIVLRSTIAMPDGAVLRSARDEVTIVRRSMVTPSERSTMNAGARPSGDQDRLPALALDLDRARALDHHGLVEPVEPDLQADLAARGACTMSTACWMVIAPLAWDSGVTHTSQAQPSPSLGWRAACGSR